MGNGSPTLFGGDVLKLVEASNIRSCGYFPPFTERLPLQSKFLRPVQSEIYLECRILNVEC
ncbi:MAG: hypothetical protein QME42_02755, partial [bacterium]|nr:hypothetical protein [bacterium]